jgi:hypothetical protein
VIYNHGTAVYRKPNCLNDIGLLESNNHKICHKQTKSLNKSLNAFYLLCFPPWLQLSYKPRDLISSPLVFKLRSLKQKEGTLTGLIDQCINDASIKSSFRCVINTNRSINSALLLFDNSYSTLPVAKIKGIFCMYDCKCDCSRSTGDVAWQCRKTKEKQV